MSEQITKAEFAIMDALWDEAPLAASEVAERMPANNAWSVKTVKTLLSRLVEKGAVAHKPDGRRYLYRPLVSKQSYAQGAASKLADQLFNGRAAPMVAHLAEGRDLSPDDIKDLEKLVKELKRGRE